MSRNKRGGAADDIYAEFNGGFRSNPAINRQKALEVMYQDTLMELAINRFKWEGFPPTIDTRFLEVTLFFNALSVFYFDKKYSSFFALRAGGNNWLNMVGNPVGFNVIGTGPDFVGAQLSAVRDTPRGGKAIPIWANYLRRPELNKIHIYAAKLADLDRTIEINSHNARNTKVIAASQEQQLSIENINNQIDDGYSVVKVRGAAIDMQFMQIVDLNVDTDAIEKLHIVRTRLWNECMGLLGIDNANQDKKERLVAAETDANNEQTSMMRYVNLNARRIAAEQINSYYGEQIKAAGGGEVTVEYYTDEERSTVPAGQVAISEDED